MGDAACRGPHTKKQRAVMGRAPDGQQETQLYPEHFGNLGKSFPRFETGFLFGEVSDRFG